MQVSWKHLYSLPLPTGNCSLEMALRTILFSGSGFLKSSQSSCSWGCGHWKAWLGRFVSTGTHFTWGRRPQFLSTWASPQASCRVSLLHGGWPSPEQAISETARWEGQCLPWSLKPHTSALLYAGQMGQPWWLRAEGSPKAMNTREAGTLGPSGDWLPHLATGWVGEHQCITGTRIR